MRTHFCAKSFAKLLALGILASASHTLADDDVKIASLQPASEPDVGPTSGRNCLSAEQQRIAAMRRASEATVAIFGLDGGGGGSGCVDNARWLHTLTNYHVSSACGDHMRCGLNDGRVYDAVIVGVDATGDVSLIKLLGREDFPYSPH